MELTASSVWTEFFSFELLQKLSIFLNVDPFTMISVWEISVHGGLPEFLIEE